MSVHAAMSHFQRRVRKQRLAFPEGHKTVHLLRCSPFTAEEKDSHDTSLCCAYESFSVPQAGLPFSFPNPGRITAAVT